LRGSIAMSETRPPITAGPIDRALRFLKSASVSWGGVAEGVGVAVEDKTAGALSEAVGDEVAIGGVCSCASEIEAT
jgi:hypothetical protein